MARRVSVSRQTIYAIEAGTYVPNTEVALNLARELEVTVEELFSLPEESSEAPDSLSSDLLSAAAPAKIFAIRIDVPPGPDRSKEGTVYGFARAGASPFFLSALADHQTGAQHDSPRGKG